MKITNADALGLSANQKNAARTSGANGNTSNSAPKSAVDQNTFMTLLVAQLKNQDPLEPQGGAEFVAQLAQFNSLEQLININDQLGQLVTQWKTQQTAAGIDVQPAS